MPSLSSSLEIKESDKTIWEEMRCSVRTQFFVSKAKARIVGVKTLNKIQADKDSDKRPANPAFPVIESYVD